MDKIESTLNEIKDLLAKLIGTSDLPKEKQFSEKAIEKATKEFKKLRRENNVWIKTHEIGNHIKDAPYEAGKFIREEFEFKNFHTKGPACYYLKSDIILLAEELKKRKIDLRAYMQMKEKEKKNSDYNITQKKNPKGAFKIPDNLNNIQPRPEKQKSLKKLMAKLNNIMAEYHKDGLSDYIEIADNLALPKSNYSNQKVEITINEKVKKWWPKYNRVQSEIANLEKDSE